MRNEGIVGQNSPATRRVIERTENDGRRNTRSDTRGLGTITVRLHDDTQRQITELKEMQTDLQQWYSMKPGKPAATLN